MMRPFKAIGKDTLNPDGRAMRRHERQFEAALTRALNRLRIDLTRGLTDANAEELVTRLNDDALTRPFQDAIVRELQAVALAGSDFGRQQVEGAVFGVRKAALEMTMWELANNAAADWALSYGYELVRGLLSTTRDRLQREVAEYIRNSETIGELTRRIASGEIFGESRARMIAVTEVTRAYAEGNRAAWKASGVIEGREWRTNADELVCPVCGPLAGQVAGLDENFGDGISGPPAHPRCRCWVVPVVE
jgi:SPP1 gp7 family putative phage head morphogenesis protein